MPLDENKAALKVQKTWRGCTGRKTVRRRIVGKARLVCRVVKLQKTWRGFYGRKTIEKRNQAAAKIQLSWKKRHHLRGVTGVRHKTRSLNRIQKWWRSILEKKRNKSATLLQKSWRGHNTRLKIESQVKAANKIQSMYRTAITVSTANDKFNEQCFKASLQIQTVYRGFATRRKLLLFSMYAMLIQAWFRKYSAARKNFYAATIQHAWKSHISVKTKPTVSNQQIATIQRFVRGHLTRVRVYLMQSNATLIQRIVRGFLKRGRMVNWKAARHNIATKVGAWWRGYQTRRILYKTNLYAEKIQGLVRGVLARKHHVTLVRSSITIQHAFRYHLYRKDIQDDIDMLLSCRVRQIAATSIQKNYRRYLTNRSFALRLENEKKQLVAEHAKMEEREKDSAATAIQAQWRGHTARRWYAGVSIYSTPCAFLPMDEEGLDEGYESLFSLPLLSQPITNTPSRWGASMGPRPCIRSEKGLSTQIAHAKVQLAQLEHHLDMHRRKRASKYTIKHNRAASRVSFPCLVPSEEIVSRLSVQWDEEEERAALVTKLTKFPLGIKPVKRRDTVIGMKRAGAPFKKNLLQDILENKKTVTRLDLASRGLTDITAHTVVKALQGNTNVKELVLDNNHISDETCKALSAMLESNRALERLSIRNNQFITSKGASSLLATVSNTPNRLTSLSVADTSASIEVVRQVDHYFAGRSSGPLGL